MSFNDIKINFLGDSITAGNSYVSIIAEKTGAICRNYGVGGSSIAKQINPQNDFETKDFCSRVNSMDADANLIFVFGGTNDFGHGDAPFGKFSDNTSDTFYGALHTLYSSLIDKYPESDIIIVTPLHREHEQYSNDLRKCGMKKSLKSYVYAIKEVAEYYSLPILDFYAESGIQPNIPIMKEKYMPDGLHPNHLGHEILAKKMISYLKTRIHD